MSAKTPDRLIGARRRSGGFALLMVLLLIATSSVVGISYIYGSQVKTASTGNLILASEARYLAESGLQHGLYSLRTRATPFGSAKAPNGPYHTVAGDGGYVFYISATSVPNDYRIVATGTAGGISQTIAMIARLTSDYAMKMIDLEPRYWWRLGDSGFRAVDEQEHDDGIYVNGVIRGTDGAILGDANTAATFRGSTDYINLGRIEKLDYNRITFGCWVRADRWANTWARIIARAPSPSVTDRCWQISMNGSAHKVRFNLRLKDTQYELVGPTRFELGQWYFVVATFDKDAQQMRLYLNGEPNGTKSSVLKESIRDDDHLDAWIGDCPIVPGQRPWAGPIDEVFIIKDRAMTPEQVKELFDASIPDVEVISWDD